VRGIRVVIDTAEEGSCCVFANILDQEMTATRVLVKEVRDVVNETGDDDQRARLCLLAEALPADDDEVIGV